MRIMQDFSPERPKAMLAVMFQVEFGTKTNATIILENRASKDPPSPSNGKLDDCHIAEEELVS